MLQNVNGGEGRKGGRKGKVKGGGEQEADGDGVRVATVAEVSESEGYDYFEPPVGKREEVSGI